MICPTLESDDQRDAARWRKIVQYLKLDVTREEHWERSSETSKRRVEEKVVEWHWNLEVNHEHSWKLYGSTKFEADVPRSLDEFVDKLEPIK